MAIDVGLGEKIKQAREDAGLTQDDLAYKLREEHWTLERTSGTQLSKWEKDNVDRLSWHAIAGIARVTNKPLEFFTEPNGGAGTGGDAEDPDPSGAGDGSGSIREASERRRERRTARSPRRKQQPQG